MHDDVLELHEFFVEQKQAGAQHMLLHIAEPDPSQPEKGYFFALCETNGLENKQIEAIQSLIHDIESGYYETEDTATRHAFEISLDYINKRRHQFDTRIQKKVDCIVGVASSKKLLFASTGGMYTVLFYHKGTELKLMHLEQDEEEQDDDTQLFSAVTEGRLHKDDSFFIASSNVAQYLNPQKLLRFLQQHPVRDAAAQVQKKLEQHRSEGFFAGLFVHRATKKQLPKTGKVPNILRQGSEDSIQHMLDRQRQTEETMMTPLLRLGKQSLFGKTQKKSPQHQQGRQTRRRETQTTRTAAQQELGNILLINIGKAIVFLGSSLMYLCSTLLRVLTQSLVALFYLSTNMGGKRQRVLEDIHKKKNQLLQSYQRLSVMSKALFFLTIFCAVVFVSSISYIQVNEKKKALAAERESLMTQIDEKKDMADSRIVYGAEEDAMRLLREAQSDLDALGQMKQADLTYMESTRRAIAKSIQDIQRITPVTPQTRAVLRDANPEVNVQHLIPYQNQLLAYGVNDNMHYIFDTQTNSINQATHAALGNIQLSFSGTTDDVTETYVVTDADRLGLFDPETNAFLNREFLLNNESSEIVAATNYNNRIYSVDRINNQIYKHNKTQQGFDKGNPWIQQQGIDLSNTRDIAIDGRIYLLQPNTLLQFSRGKQEAFRITQLEPVLNDATSLWTNGESEYLYIFEAETKRVILLDKKGRLVRQFTFDELNNPTDIWIDETQEEIFVLADQTLYSFSSALDSE